MNFMQSKNRQQPMQSNQESSHSDPDPECISERKSIEDLLSGSGKDEPQAASQPNLSNNNNSSTNLDKQPPATNSSRQPSPPSPAPNSNPSPKKHSPQPSTSSQSSGGGPVGGSAHRNGRREQSRSDTLLLVPCNLSKGENSEDSQGKSSDSSSARHPSTSSDHHNKSSSSGSQPELDRPKSVSKVTERARKKAWYSVLYPSYKSRSEDFKKLFKEVPDDERLIVDYSCAIQRDILVHGRLYVSQNFLCFYANIFRWETCLCLRWKDVTSVTKEKTALVIPNAILVCTQNEKNFLTSFATRDKAYLMLFRVWQNALMGKQMQPQEMWQWVHNCYGDELGLTSDDEDYIDPYEGKEEKIEVLYNIPKSELCTKSPNCIVDETPNSDQFDDDVEDKSATLKAKDHEPNIMRVRSSRTARLVSRDNSQSIDQLPTDMSDSSDSDTNKISFTNQAECTSMHEGRQLVHTILPITVDNLFSLLFTKSKFLVEFHNQRKTTNMVHGDWIINEEGLKERTCTLTIVVTPAVGPKSSNVTQVAVIRKESKAGELFSVDMIATNAGIPYADSFYVPQHFCLQRTVDDHTVFSVHAEIKYKKSVWGVVKGFIEKNTWVGLEEFYTALVRALQSEYCIPPAKSKARVKRRVASIQPRPSDEPRASIKSIPASITSVIEQKSLKEPALVSKSRRYERLSWFVIILLICLIAVNVFLYFKLWNLEEMAVERDTYPNFSTIKDPPKTHEEWLRILQHQESLHATEMMKWQKVLQSAIELLRKTERALTDLQFLIKIQRSGPISSDPSSTTTSPFTVTANAGDVQKFEL